MRRDSRKLEKREKNKSLIYIGGSILAIGILVFAIAFVLYDSNMEKQSKIDTTKIADLIQNNTETASTQMGKSVEESKNQIEDIPIIPESKNKTQTSTNSSKNTVTTNKSTKQAQTKKEEVKKEETEVKKEEIKFIQPVEGEIIKEFAKDNLVYSQTLQEWTTHTAIDYKAEKTTIVKAAADGKVKSIKNDPRYGLSIIIEHQEGYESLYANLLTSEFVQIGEEVKSGQSIGTVGNTATFEIADEPHLHFEIIKDGVAIDPRSVQ
ncbi:MAG: peptidoglycan DD-metalloendopeptidase family protein [Clostridia bacterium]|jgi:murein DD-endopeptidase MepM/ murein hydrolase activator NlpD|nr:peptidoglycan DD-metalloendopeptidase family protein [Clostridia bacterium]